MLVVNRLRHSLSQHPLAADTALALILALLVSASAAFSVRGLEQAQAGTGWRVVLSLAVALPLILRRRQPWVALCSSLLLAIVAVAFAGAQPSVLLPVTILLYTIGVRGKRRESLLVAGLAIFFAVLVRRLVADGPVWSVEILRDIAWAAGSVAVGDAVAMRRAYVEEIQVRALWAERTKEEEAQRRVNEERLRIARDVHDGVAHALASISLQAGAASAVLDSDPSGARAALVQIRAASKSALSELRATLGVLRENEEGALVLILGSEELEELSQVVKAGGIDISVVHDEVIEALPAAVGGVAYRILREALTNVLRHSGAQHVDVSVLRRGDSVALCVRDDGQGPADGGRGSGFGLQSMRERAVSVGGSLQVGPRPGGGFLVEALLPLVASP